MRLGLPTNDIHGNGFYVDLEPRRAVEIENLLKLDDASSKEFENKAEYLNYISNIVEPQLPWESQNELIKIIKHLLQDISEYEIKLNEPTNTWIEERLTNLENELHYVYEELYHLKLFV